METPGNFFRPAPDCHRKQPHLHSSVLRAASRPPLSGAVGNDASPTGRLRRLPPQPVMERRAGTVRLRVVVPTSESGEEPLLVATFSAIAAGTGGPR